MHAQDSLFTMLSTQLQNCSRNSEEHYQVEQMEQGHLTDPRKERQGKDSAVEVGSEWDSPHIQRAFHCFHMNVTDSLSPDGTCYQYTRSYF